MAEPGRGVCVRRAYQGIPRLPLPQVLATLADSQRLPERCPPESWLDTAER